MCGAASDFRPEAPSPAPGGRPKGGRDIKIGRPGAGASFGGAGAGPFPERSPAPVLSPSPQGGADLQRRALRCASDAHLPGQEGLPVQGAGVRISSPAPRIPFVAERVTAAPGSGGRGTALLSFGGDTQLDAFTQRGEGPRHSFPRKGGAGESKKRRWRRPSSRHGKAKAPRGRAQGWSVCHVHTTRDARREYSASTVAQRSSVSGCCVRGGAGLRALTTWLQL